MAADVEDEERNLVLTAIEFVRIVTVFSLNLLLYAVPLTFAGYEFGQTETAPEGIREALDPIVVDPDMTWALTLGIVQNSAFLLVATLLTFFTFHVGVLLAGASGGILQSLRAVSHSTGIYLAVMFTLTWHAATSEEISVAETFLVWLQAEFLRYFIDFVGADLAVPGNPPESVALEGLTDPGLMVLVGLLLSGVYYLYALYLGARVGQDASRIEAGLVTGFVLISPALYAIGIILFTLWT